MRNSCHQSASGDCGLTSRCAAILAVSIISSVVIVGLSHAHAGRVQGISYCLEAIGPGTAWVIGIRCDIAESIGRAGLKAASVIRETLGAAVGHPMGEHLTEV